jgi:hypothetical protein
MKGDFFCLCNKCVNTLLIRQTSKFDVGMIINARVSHLGYPPFLVTFHLQFGYLEVDWKLKLKPTNTCFDLLLQS